MDRSAIRSRFAAVFDHRDPWNMTLEFNARFEVDGTSLIYDNYYVLSGYKRTSKLRQEVTGHS